MKKLMLFAVAASLSFTVFAQDGFRLGLNAGIPVGDADRFSSFTGGIDLDYDWSISANDNLNAGLTTGFTSYFAKSGFGSFDFIPVGGSIDYSITDDISIGGDAGIAISLNSGGGTDFMYRFQFRYQATEKVDVSARYNSVSGSGITISDIGISVGYRFN